jgi:hypothetical protein
MVKETKIGMIQEQIPSEDLDNLPSYTTDHVSVLDIPADARIPGYEIGFIALKVMGQDQKGNWSNAWKDGYRPVIATEHPRLAAIFMGPPMPGETVIDDYVRLNDLLLMKIPKELSARLQSRKDKNQSEMEQKSNWSNQTLFEERGFKGFDKSETGYGNIKERSFGE